MKKKSKSNTNFTNISSLFILDCIVLFFIIVYLSTISPFVTGPAGEMCSHQRSSQRYKAADRGHDDAVQRGYRHGELDRGNTGAAQGGRAGGSHPAGTQNQPLGTVHYLRAGI